MSPRSLTGDRQGALLRWGEANRRDLPWRRSRDPWAVLISELMLQQTQAPRVATRWDAFLREFPTPAACAEAGPGAVVRAWSGLGYNRRALNLHRSAEAIVTHHGGHVPDSLDALLALPGIGPYTARAVLVFAFGRDLGLVDTNAGRFVARALAGRAVTRREAQDVADAAVPPGQSWAWGQAVFDLGVLVCTRNQPSCDRCPVAAHCAWFAAGRPAPDPVAGSAGISGRQSRFSGSDRQGHGRLVERLRGGPVAAAGVAAAAGWPSDHGRAARIASGLVADGLAVADAEGTLRLP